jgi:predicted nucleic acid-binding protein
VLYLDTSCLVKLYYPEPDSSQVSEATRGQRLIYTALHELEISTALQLKVFREEATRKQANAAQDLLNQDVESGILCRLSISFHEPLFQAVSLSRQYAARLGCRSLDLLHCATASWLDVGGFLSTDDRQVALAKAIGLPLLTIPA